MDAKKEKAIRKALKKTQNPNVKSAKFLWNFLMYGSVVVFVYWIFAAVANNFFLESKILKWWYGFAPYVMILSWVLLKMFIRNFREIRVWVKYPNRGRVLGYMNDNRSHWSRTHRIKAVRWMYPGRKEIRLEKRLALTNKVAEGHKLSSEEKNELKKRVVSCPQQLLDGFNKAILVSILIYAHHNIHYLDQDLRNFMELTDDNMLKFDLQGEINKCKTDDTAKRIEIGKRKMKEEKLKNKSNE